jgi:hypothetical protein
MPQDLVPFGIILAALLFGALVLLFMTVRRPGIRRRRRSAH